MQHFDFLQSVCPRLPLVMLYARGQTLQVFDTLEMLVSLCVSQPHAVQLAVTVKKKKKSASLTGSSGWITFSSWMQRCVGRVTITKHFCFYSLSSESVVLRVSLCRGECVVGL